MPDIALNYYSIYLKESPKLYVLESTKPRCAPDLTIHYPFKVSPITSHYEVYILIKIASIHADQPSFLTIS